MSKVQANGWRYARCGPIANVLRREAFAVTPAKDHAVVEMIQAPLHRVDSSVVNGTALLRKQGGLSPFPRIGGSEGVGKVISTGGSPHVREGDIVWVAPLHGTWATHVAAPPDFLHKIDKKHIGLATTASNFLLAQHMINGFARLQKEQVLVQNGGSSITSLAVSALAKSRGVAVVTAASQGERFEDAKRRHGKYGSQVVEYSGKGAREAHKLVGGAGGAALFLNGVGGRDFDTFLKLMRKNSHVVTYGAQNGYGLMFSGSNLIYNEVTMDGVYLPRLLSTTPYKERQTQLDFVLGELSAAGFEYPMVSAKGLERLPDVWDDVFIHGGKKGVLSLAS